jgi:hypothetical protein
VQPLYVTLSSSGSSPWKTADWHISPQMFGFAIISSGGSSGTIDVALEDPQGVYPSPVSSAPTPFVLATWGATATTVTGLTSFAIAAWRLTVNSLSSAGARVTLATIQAGIG